MIITKLNLTDPNDSDIKFKISRFPDGQQAVDIESAPMYINGLDVKIYSRMNSFRDIELIIAANQALREMGVGSVSLYVPYFLGARSDRKFQQGGTNYLKQVICPIINSQRFDRVLVLDPHSDVLEACLNNFEKINNFTIVKQALTDIDNRNDARDRICLVSPDGGALKKIYDIAHEFKIHHLVTAMKHRDIQTGKINHTEVPNLPVSVDGEKMKYVIVDDICDGGRTFTELAKAIHGQQPEAKLYLIVTHGIFSAGFEDLSKYFTKIYTSNSVKDIMNENDDTDTERAAKQIVTQFNVF
jgi:ribose-phosphate pyrophosphokinase